MTTKTGRPEATDQRRGDGGVEYAIVTVSRPTNYIHQLIATLRCDLQLRLVVGSPDTAFLAPCRGNPRIEILTAPSQEWARFRGCSVHQRACWNYWRSLVLVATNKARSGLLVFEDDVILALGWNERLYETIKDIENLCGDRFVLALYTTARLTPVPGRHYSPYPVQAFFGTQAMYYPELVRRDFSEYLRQNGVDNYRQPYDLLLQEFLGAHGIQLFGTVPCFAQHIGEVSTGLGDFHQASCFAAVV